VSGACQPKYNLSDTSSITLEDAHANIVLSKVANEYSDKKAFIVKNQASAWTSGTAQAKGWSIKMAHSNKWNNTLMGWLSGKDNTHQPCNLLTFDTSEQAVFFCERNGWPYEVKPEVPPSVPVALDAKTKGNQYSYNIFPLAVQKAMKDAGAPRRAKSIFAHPKSPTATGVSTWDNHRHTGYGPDKWRPRNDKVKLTQEAWTGPSWAPTKEITPPSK